MFTYVYKHDMHMYTQHLGFHVVSWNVYNGIVSLHVGVHIPQGAYIIYPMFCNQFAGVTNAITTYGDIFIHKTCYAETVLVQSMHRKEA